MESERKSEEVVMGTLCLFRQQYLFRRGFWQFDQHSLHIFMWKVIIVPSKCTLVPHVVHIRVRFCSVGTKPYDLFTLNVCIRYHGVVNKLVPLISKWCQISKVISNIKNRKRRRSLWTHPCKVCVIYYSPKSFTFLSFSKFKLPTSAGSSLVTNCMYQIL